MRRGSSRRCRATRAAPRPVCRAPLAKSWTRSGPRRSVVRVLDVQIDDHLGELDDTSSHGRVVEFLMATSTGRLWVAARTPVAVATMPSFRMRSGASSQLKCSEREIGVDDGAANRRRRDALSRPSRPTTNAGAELSLDHAAGPFGMMLILLDSNGSSVKPGVLAPPAYVQAARPVLPHMHRRTRWTALLSVRSAGVTSCHRTVVCVLSTSGDRRSESAAPIVVGSGRQRGRQAVG